MRAVYITNTPAPYQIHFAEELAKHMEMEFWFSMKSTGRKRPAYWEQSLPTNCEMLPFESRVKQFKTVRRKLQHYQPQVVWLGGDWKMPSWVAAYRWAKEHRVPVVAGPIERPDPAEPLSKVVARDVAMKALFPEIDAFLAPGYESYDRCKYLYKNAVAHMYPYAADIESYLLHDVRKPEQEVVFLAGGRMDRQVRFPEVLRVYSRICKKYENTRLSLTGWGAELEECQKLVREDEALRAHVDWRKVESWEGVGDFYLTGDVSIAYHRWGGWGLMVQETMASGMGQICSGELSAGRFFVQDAVNGFLAYSDEDLFRAMEHYVLNPADVFTHGTINKKLAVDSSFPKQSVKLLEIFQSLI